MTTIYKYNSWKRFHISIYVLFVGISIFLFGMHSMAVGQGNLNVEEDILLAQVISNQYKSNEKLMSTTFIDFNIIQDVVRGTVVDAQTGEALIGVNVVVDGTTTGTSTNMDGEFELQVPNLEETLVFSFIGYQRLVVNINGRTEINVELTLDLQLFDDIIVIGYGVQDQRDVTGAISSVDSGVITQRAPTNVFEAIQGQMAGVQLTTSSGAPGENASLRIRGISTFDAGSDPLYILDGQPIDNIDHLNPNDIKSIEVLKDGASAAIYGSKAANGVVLISTKGGQVGATSIDVNYLRSYSTTRRMPQATTNQRLAYEEYKGILAPQRALDTRNQIYQYNIFLQDEVYRTAQKDQLNFAVASGNEDTRLYWNTGILNQEGVIMTTQFMRINSRLNLDHKFNDRISVGVRTNLSYDESKNIDPGLEFEFVGQTLSTVAMNPLYEIDGTFLPNVNRLRGRDNPVMAYTNMDVRRKNLRVNLFNHLELKLIENLYYRANFGVDGTYSRNTDFLPEYIGSRNTNVDATFSSKLPWNWIHESYFNYAGEFMEDHKIGGLIGFSAQKWSASEEQIDARLSSSYIPTLNNASQIFIGNTYTLNEGDHSLASFFARVNYSYKDRYLLSATLRRDGSSRFGSDNRWGNFPAMSIGWRFNEESFMEPIGFIQDAKVRASYAITGNERIGNRDFDTQLTTGNFYNGISGVAMSSRMGNPSIRWEETKQSNLGVDITTLEARLNISIDYYVKKTNDLLASQPLAAETGLNNVRVNLGDVQNKGIEFAVQATPYSRKGVLWTTNFNIATNTNEVTRLAGNTAIIGRNHITQVGSPLGSFFGYTILGVFAYDESNAFTCNGTQLTPNFDASGNFTNYTLDGSDYNGEVFQKTVGGITSKGGDFNWRDLNGDFRIDGDDREILGNPYPKYFGGIRNEISYKGFSFSFLFDFQKDVQVFNSFASWNSQLGQNAPTPPPYVLDNLYKGPGDETAVFPLPGRSQNELGTGAPTSHWVEDADFVKLRNIRLSYDLPVNLINSIGLNKLTIYGSINNVLTWTNYRGFDPEVNIPGNPLQSGVDDARYPRSREFLFGINVNL